MKTINFNSSFRTALKAIARKHPELVASILEKTLLLIQDTNHPSLKVHKLHGRLKEHWSFSIAPDLRIIFRYTPDGNSLFVNIGNHDELY